MDALVNYGSDDESSDKCVDNKGRTNDDPKTVAKSHGDSADDVNYDNVQMDMSEESDAGQRQKGGDTRRNSSTSSSPNSSSEEDDEPPRVKHRISVSSSRHSKKSKENSDKDGGGSSIDKHRKKEDSRRSPGQKESSKHRSKKERRRSKSRSRDRGGKPRESKERDREKRRHGSSRDRGGPHDGDRESSRRKSGREGSGKRSRSREKARDRHHSDRRRSRSRSPHHHRHHHGHHDDDRRSKRSRGRSPSKTQSGDESRTAEAKKANAVSRAVAAAAANIAAVVAATEAAQSSSVSSSSSSKNEGGSQSNSELGEDGNQLINTKTSQQALLEGLGLQVEGSLTKTAVTNLPTSLITPQILVQRSLEVQASQVHNTTGIQFPSYYNPAAMNPTKYAEQMQKRKKLWGGNKDTAKDKPAAGSTGGSTNNWESTTFAQDQDGKLSAKFKRLMGIKTPGAANTAPAQPEGTTQSPEDVIKKQEELFSTMERQYEAARLATHTLRGVGLGFGSSSAYQYPR